MATLPQFKQRQVARRSSSDISRLAKQYTSSIGAITGEYETAFSGYQAGAAAKMKPFEEASEKYKQELAGYTTNVAAPYKSALEAYQANSVKYLTELAELATGAKDRFSSAENYTYRKGGQTYSSARIRNPFTGEQIQYNQDIFTNPEKYGFQSALTPVEGGYRGQNKYTFRPMPETAAPVTPEKPAAFAGVKPEMPEIGEFDAAQFTAKKAEAESTFKREVGERRAARIGAVSRKITRPLLAGE